MGVVDEARGLLGTREVTLDSDEGIRPDTTLEGVSKIRTVLPGGVITAGNASQFSDGASACVVMDSKLAEQRGLEPLGIFAVSLLPAVSRTRWESVPCLPYPDCSSERA